MSCQHHFLYRIILLLFITLMQIKQENRLDLLQSAILFEKTYPLSLVLFPKNFENLTALNCSIRLFKVITNVSHPYQTKSPK